MYSDTELDEYPLFMEYNRSIIREHTYLPKKVMSNMLAGKTLHKIDENTWSIDNGGYSVKLSTFKNWILQKERNKKLEEILRC